VHGNGPRLARAKAGAALSIRVPAAAFNQDADKTMKQLSDSGFDAERLGDKILNFV